MAFQCNGTAYCQDSNTAVITIRSNSESETITIQNAPICITTTSDGNTKCWKFSGKDTSNINSFELFACGINPSFLSEGNGLALYLDEVRLGGSNYRYGVGTASVTEVTQVIRGNVFQSDGNCNSCLGGSSTNSSNTKVTITDKNNNQVYQKIFNGNPSIQVSCNGCPPNHIKCNCNSYPGYCCIPCNEIKGGIAAATAAVRGINRG